MLIPNYRDDGWLPLGHYNLSWDEITEKFSGKPGSLRNNLMQELIKWRDELRENNIYGTLLLDGSFISNKEEPSDFDAMFIYDENIETLFISSPELYRLVKIEECKKRGFDLFALPLSLKEKSPLLFGLDLFDKDKNGIPKGVVEVKI